MLTASTTYHTPVLLTESVQALLPERGGTYVDVTFGGGGHSREIMRRLPPGGRLYAFDQDRDAERNAIADPRFTFVRSNFRYLRNWMRYYGVEGVSGILADLGVSGHHFDDASRGFTLREDAPLDMRMNQRGGLTAADVVNTYDEARLADILFLYGELRQARRLAAAIVRARAEQPVATSGQLLAAAAPLLPPGREKKEAARLFQALRIEVNHELTALSDMLRAAIDVLAPGGRLAVITYHSLEDRLVKNLMRSGNTEGRVEKDFYGRALSPLKALTAKPVTPSDGELAANPRSRSAKLRVAEKTQTT